MLWSVQPAAALVVLVAALVSAGPVHAQNDARIFGVVTDSKGQPVSDATVTMEFKGGLTRKYATKTNAKGEFIQVGLTAGPYSVTASREGLGGANGTATVRAGQAFRMNLALLPPGAAARDTLSEADRSKAERLEESAKAFGQGLEATRSGNLGEAVTLFNAALETSPECADCHRNLGIVFTWMKDYSRAEAAFKQGLVLQPEDAAAYAGLADVYNAQRKFTEAAEASAQAARLKGGAATAGGSAMAVFDQGLILWNAGKVDEARKQFEETLRLDPTHAEAHYWLGMANLNGGETTEAAAELKLYLDRDPKGRFAAQAAGILKQLQP